MRRAANVDANQKEIVEFFRDEGATVAVTSMVGAGFPDLVIGYMGRNILVEIKDGKKPPSKKRLRDEQLAFFNSWGGDCVVVESCDGAQILLDEIRGSIDCRRHHALRCHKRITKQSGLFEN